MRYRNGFILLRRSLISAALALVLGLGGAAIPAKAADPASFVGDLGSRALQVLSQKGIPPAVRQQRFSELFQADFDVPGISRFVLGRYWRVATPQEQEEFVRLFESYVIITYSARLSEYTGETFRVLGTRSDQDGILVGSEIQRVQGPPVRVDWRLAQEGGAYKIIDVVVENVSMAVTQRSEFASVIQRSGGQVEGLLAAMRSKTASIAQ